MGSRTADAQDVMDRLRIKRELGTKFRCYLWPASSDALPDNRELKLAVLDPEATPSLQSPVSWIDRRGDSFRVYKNTVFFAIPDAGRHARFEDEIREYLALHEIKEEIERDERAGMTQKKAEVERRVRDLEEDFPLRVRELLAQHQGATGLLVRVVRRRRAYGLPRRPTSRST